jgi:hypothetical protein
MSSSFDPYHKWLGIRPQEQPANHYRLLGIGMFESDPDVIDSAADQRTLHVRSFQTGPHAAESQKLLNEIAAALLQPAERAAYDEKLRGVLAPPELVRPVAVAPSAPMGEAFQVVELPQASLKSQPRGPRARSRQPPISLFVAGGAALALLGLVVIVALASRAGNSNSATGQPRKRPAGKPSSAESEPAKPKNDHPPAQVTVSTPGKPQQTDLKSASPKSQAGQSVIRVDFNREDALSDFLLAEAPGRKWLVDGGVLHIEGGFAHTTYRTYFKSIKSVTIRGGIQSLEGRNFRVSIGPLNMILNWEGADQNHYRLGEALSAPIVTEPHALAPGRIQEITVRQDGNDVIVEINGQRQCSLAGELEGTVSVYSASSAIFVQEIVVEGEVEPARKVTEPSHRNLY